MQEIERQRRQRWKGVPPGRWTSSQTQGDLTSARCAGNLSPRRAFFSSTTTLSVT